VAFGIDAKLGGKQFTALRCAMKTVLGWIATGRAIGVAIALGCWAFAGARCALADPPAKDAVVGPSEQSPASSNTATGELLGARVRQSASGEVIVDQVQRGGAAFRYGIRPGNQIVSIDGKQLASIDDFNPHLNEHSANQDLRIVVKPGTERRYLKTMFPPPADGYENALARPVARLGVTLRRSGTQVTVAQLYSGGPADIADVRSGDQIQAIDGQAITSRKNLYDLLQRHKVGDSVVVRLAPTVGGLARDAGVTLINRRELAGRELVMRLLLDKTIAITRPTSDDWLDADDYDEETIDPDPRMLDFDG
jgi:S1-C subfamily serine protease